MLRLCGGEKSGQFDRMVFRRLKNGAIHKCISYKGREWAIQGSNL